MTDPVLDGKLVVGDTNGSGPYVDLLRSRLPEVEAVLKAEGVRHWWVHDITFSFDNEPPLSTIYFGRNNNYANIWSVFARHPELGVQEATT